MRRLSRFCRTSSSRKSKTFGSDGSFVLMIRSSLSRVLSLSVNIAKPCELAFPIVLSYFRANYQLEEWRRGGSLSREGDEAMSGPENTPPKDNKDWEGFREIDILHMEEDLG